MMCFFQVKPALFSFRLVGNTTRKLATFLRHYPAYKSKQLNVSELARASDISITTVYKDIRLLEG